MTVAELIERLEAMPPDWEVILSSDSEGNGFHTVYDVERAHDIELRLRTVLDAVVLWP